VVGPITTLATLHPAYLLRNPEAKRYAWRDLLMVKEALQA
jgi:DNA polymerase